MNFYKSVIEHHGKLLVRGIHNGQEFKEKIDYSPTLYAISQQQTEFKTLTGQNLKPIQFGSIKKARDFKRNYNTDNAPIFGMDRYQYQYIADNYPEDIEWSKDHIKIFTLDIECTAENGFPDVQNPIEELLAITVKNQSNKQIITWGTGDYKTDRSDITYIKCRNEKSLIMEFMKFWMKNYPDVITGWNTKFFDLPYLCNRIKLLTDEKVVRRLSPWNLVGTEEITVRGRSQLYYDLYGIAMLDYLDLYKKFIPVRQESYKLDHIGKVELGLAKDSNPYDTFREWYTKDFQSFVDYNIKDVEIVDQLEDKLKLIEENEKKGILKSTTLDRFERDGQWCFIKIVIRQKGDDIIKEEIMECADTEHGRTDKEKIAELEKQIELEKAKKPGYWELFAAFYYKDLNAPEYCRLYSQPSHAYKAIGTACLTTDGKWERR